MNYKSMISSNLNIVNGKLTNIMSNEIVEVVSKGFIITPTQSLIIETEFGGNNITGIDGFTIDGVGFTLIESMTPYYTILNPYGNPTIEVLKSGLAIGTKFRVEVTSTEYILTVGTEEKARFIRNSVYSSPNGNFTSASISVPTNPLLTQYNTPVVFYPTVDGSGFIEVQFNVGINKRENVTISLPNKPFFGSSTVSLTNTCPDTYVSLYSLVDQNSKTGYSLEYHTVAIPTSDSTKITNLNISTSGIIYAIQKENGKFCYGLSTPINISIQNCCTPVTTAILNGPDITKKGQSATYVVTGLNGTGPYTFNWTVINGEIIGSTTSDMLVVNPVDHPLNVQVVINNCNGIGSLIRSKNSDVQLDCSKSVIIDLNCKMDNVENVIVTLQGVSEPNRIVNFTNTTITFKTSIGQHNYHVRVYGSENEYLDIYLKNIICS